MAPTAKLPWIVAGSVALVAMAAARAAGVDETIIDLLPTELSDAQIYNARIINQMFRKEIQGCTDGLCMAAIANAYRESELHADATGDASTGTAHSFGLFQCNLAGAGAGWDPQDLLDPANNTAAILAVVRSGEGFNLLLQMAAGASAKELAAIFCTDIERPADKTGEAQKSRQLVTYLFGL